MEIKRKKPTKELEEERARNRALMDEAAAKITPTAAQVSSSGRAERQGGYYSPRQYGAQTQALNTRVQSARAAMQENASILDQSARELERLRGEMINARDGYYNTKGKFRGDSAADHERDMLDKWTTATRVYSDGYAAHQRAMEQYQPYEDAYNQAVTDYNDYLAAEEAEYRTWRSTIRDAESIRAEQRELEQKRAELESLMKRNNLLQLGNRDQVMELVIAQNEERIRELQAYLGAKGEREKLLQEELGWSEHFLFEDMREKADFATMSGADSNVQDSRYRYVNDPAFRTEYQAQLIQSDPGAIIPKNDLYEAGLDMLTDEERALYNYVYRTGGKEQAERYLATITNDLIERKSQQEFARMQGNTFAEVAFGAPAGVDSFEQGMKGWFGGEAPNGVRQVLGSMAREDLSDVGWKLPEWMGGASLGQMAYDTVNTTANMAPSILAGTIGQMGGLGGVGTAMLGFSAGGNARQEALREGYTEGQATAYGAMVGAAEAVMEKLLGGISSLGGKGIGRFTNGRFTNFLNKLDSAFLRTAAQIGEKMVSEGTEEYLQEILEPILRNAALGEENELELVTPEALYSGLLGAMTGGLMEGPGIISQNAGKGKKTSAAQKKASNEAESATDDARPNAEVDGRRLPQSLSDSSPTQSAGEPLGDAAGVVDSKMEKTTPVAGGTEGSSAVENAASPEGIVLPKVEPVEQNGGSSNGEEAGERVLPGGPERHDAAGAGEQAGGYAEHRERQQTEARSQAEAAAQRRVKAENLEKRGHLKRVSAQDLGLRQGTEVQELLELPRIEWDRELCDTATRLEKETGMQVRTVAGNIGVRLKGGGVGLAKGYIDRVNKAIVLNVCHSQVTAGQIADHELWHHKMDAVGRISGDRYEVTRLAAQRIQEEYSPEDFDEVLDAYIDGYGDVYDQGNWEEFLNRVYEEIMADAYAGINAFGTEAGKYRNTVDDTMNKLGMGRNMWNASEQEDAPAPGGDTRVYNDEDAPPPMPEYEDHSQVPEYDWDGWDDSMIDFSYGGENARNADREALERAQRMEEQGFDKQQIFRDTGWFRGADGKWRFEIDDSGMKYHKMGDAQFGEDHPEYTRFRELELKFIEGTIADAELAEMAELRSTWANEAPRLRQMVARGNAKLYHVLAHDALFEQYPQLRNTGVRFGDTDNAGGYWDQERNEIVLSNRYRRADPTFLELTLLHEIQHAIQDIEGFAGGSNPEYWERVQSGDRAIRENDAKIAKAEREAQAALKGAPVEIQKDFWYAANMRGNDPEGAEKLENELFESEYSDAYSDYSWAIWTLQDLLEQDNPKRTAKDLYRNTAGEIEARDAANRRGLDAAGRKKRLPDTGDERTVFVEGDSPVAKDFIGWTADGNEVYQTSVATMGMTSKDRFDAFKKKYLSTFTGRTAKFYRNGHTYYARFAQTDSELGKLAHEGNGKGSQSSTSGYKAKIRLLADGSIFELVEDAAYHSSKIETGVGKNKTHKHAKHWDYFVKTVVVDGKAYDVVINVRADSRKGDYSDKEQYVYSIRFRDNKTAATPVASPARSKVLRVDGVAVDNSVPDSGRNVKQDDVRFSLDGSLSRGEYERLAAEVARDQSKRNEEFVKSRLTPEQYKQYKEFVREERLDQEAEARVRWIERLEEAQAREDLTALRAQQAEDAAAGRRELATEEKAARAEAREKAGTAREERRRKAQEKREKLRQEARERIRRAAENAPADSVPTIARKELQDKLISLFSVGEGQRGELRREIGQLADRMIAEGTVDERDLRRLVDRLYESGVMTIEPEEVFAEGRSYLKDEHIYISPEQIRELGDDWLTLKKNAWGLGVYLTTDRSYAGLDVWNADMASYLPGLFDENETDGRTILERLLDIAQEGKAEKVSLPEYTKRIARAEHQSEEAMLYNMERQVEEALRTFGEKASLEMRLKNRENRRKAMDREEAAIVRENERSERERLRQDLMDERAYLKEQNEAERDRLKLQRAENDRRNAAERRRLAEERAARRRKHQEAVRKKELRELQEKTLKALQWISKNRRKAPEAMQEAFTAVLGNIDLYAISMADEMNWSSKYGATWKDLKQMYLHAQATDPNFMPSEDLDRIVKRLDSVQLESMDFDQLRDLYQAAVGLRTEFYQRNNVIGSEEHQIMEELYRDCVEEMRTAPKKLKGLLDRFLNLEQLTPMNVFEEMGGFNPDGALYKFAQQLEAGERKVRSFKVRSNKILADFLEDNADWIHKADGQGKDGIWIEVEIPQLIGMKVGEVPEFGGTVKVAMTPMQRVHLYLESRNYDNLRHMTGGRTFSDRELYSQGKREEAFAKGTTIRMAPETVQLLVKDMSPEELELAKLLDKYYNDLAATEINKVSNILLGYNKAMGGHYAPIFTNANYTKSEFGKFDGTAEGAGNLKERVKSKNPSYNISALEAFERNMDRTATYVGMAIPVRNWNTLMNWRTSNSSFADEITHSWGKGRLDYIQDLITDLQNPMGEQQDMVTEMSGKLLSNYISSVFGFNPSIVVKQLGSIPMASAYLDWKHFPKKVIGKGKIDRELIGRYTQELDWRTMGYSMPETKQLKDTPNWSQKNKVVGLVFGGDAITAMDGWAASVLWPWAENKVRADFPGLEVGDVAMIESGQSPFYQKVAELFNDSVSRSQSVSDQMHQGRLRKSKHAAAKAFTMFRSDSAQSYNVLRQRLGELDYYRRQGEGGKEMAKAVKKTVGAAATAVLINSLWGTAVDLLVKALKGKLEEEDKEPLAVASDFFWGIVESYAGMSTFGDIAAETVGNWFTGGTSFDQEAPGVEQINDIIQAADKIINAGKKGNLIGAIKIAGETIATMGYGLPAKNVEAYLMGLFSWALPGVKVSYEDLLKAPTKADLKGLEGTALEVRMNHVLKGYGVELEPEVREALAALYEAGYTEAVPSAAPDSVTVDGVELELDERMRNAYDRTRSGIIEQEIPGVINAAFFAEADEKTRKTMLTKLYNYAAEKAKEAVLEDYPIGTTAQAIDEIVRSGGSAADYAVFDAVTADMAAWQRAEVLQEWGTDEAVTGLMFKYLVSKSWEDEQAELRKVGVDVGQFLELYTMHGQIDSRELKAGQKATEFAYWLDGQRYTDQQKAVIKDQMAYFQMMPADASRYNMATAAGLDREQALELTEELDALEPPEGKDSVQQIQKYRVAIDDSVSESNQLKMLEAVGLKDTSYDKVKTGYEMGVAPAAWVRVKEVQQQFDANGNGSMTNAEWEAAIEGICSYGIVLPGDNTRFNLTNEQKGVLWQMMVGKNTKSKNNPFDPAAGQRWRELMGYE